MSSGGRGKPGNKTKRRPSWSTRILPLLEPGRGDKWIDDRSAVKFTEKKRRAG